MQSPTSPAKVPKSVSDRKRFFENAMEDQQKPSPKSGKLILWFFNWHLHIPSSVSFCYIYIIGIPCIQYYVICTCTYKQVDIFTVLHVAFM